MISAGVEGRLPYMTYPEPWRGPPKQPPEFLRPAPKPVPSISRYNGINTSSAPNGTRLAQPARPISKYPATVTTLAAPVNLTKDEATDEVPYTPYPIYPHPPTFFNPFPIYQHQYAHIIRSAYPPSTPVSPLEAYSPTTPTATGTTSTFLPPAVPATLSPPSTVVKPGQSILRDKRTPPIITPPQATSTPQAQGSFKVPSKEVSLKGREGSLKHRILTNRPEDVQRSTIPLDLQQKAPSRGVTVPRKRLPATITSPPPTGPPRKSPTSVSSILTSFSKGSLIQLATGDLRRIEDMRTEDFVLSAQNSPELRLADSTVVKIEEDHRTGKATITLSYNQRRTQVDIESATEHPYFVYGQGWASCNPEKTLQTYGLNVHRLQVGDVLISVTPREHTLPSSAARTSTIMTTATTTAMSVRQAPVNSASRTVTIQPVSQVQQVQVVQSVTTKPGQVVQQAQPVQVQPMNLQTNSVVVKRESSSPSKQNDRPLSPDSLAARKRRWSAPDQISAQQDDQQPVRRIKME